MSKLCYRIKQGDTCGLWTEYLAAESKKDKNLYPVSRALARAVASKKIKAADVREIILRGGDPEILLGDTPVAVAEVPAPETKPVKKAAKPAKDAAEPVNPFSAVVNA